MNRGHVTTHVLGSGPSPYSLILLGHDMYLFERAENDPERGRGGTSPVSQAGPIAEPLDSIRVDGTRKLALAHLA